MTTALLLRTAAKRWYLVLCCWALTFSAAGVLYTEPSTVFWSQATVTLLQPRPNPLATEGYELADLASAIVLRVNGRPADSKTASPGTTLYGEGIVDGTRIRVRDVGQQWSTSIPDPVVLVEVVGPSPEGVGASMASQLSRLANSLDTLQQELGVAEDDRIFMRVVPETPAATPVSGSPTRAAATVVLLGCAATGVALYFVNRRWPTLPAPQQSLETSAQEPAPEAAHRNENLQCPL